MAGLEATMEHARRTLPNAAPVRRAQPAPAAATELDIAERLKRLDADQLREVAHALRGSWSLPADDDQAALRQSLVDYVDEWADDSAEMADDDPEVARAEGRQEAIGFIEEGMLRAIAPTTPQSQWRQVMGVSDARLEELIDETHTEHADTEGAEGARDA